MQAWEESSGIGRMGRSNRDFDDFDELDDDELGPDEESEFAIRYMDEEGEDDEEDEEEGDADLYEVEDEPPGGMRRTQPEEW